MPLLEGIQSVTTSPRRCRSVSHYGELKTTVETKDKAASSSTACWFRYMLDAIRGLEEGIGTIDDRCRDEGRCRSPDGPVFTLADLSRPDTFTSISDAFDEFRERRFAAPPTLRKMVAGFTVQSGRGFTITRRKAGLWSIRKLWWLPLLDRRSRRSRLRGRLSAAVRKGITPRPNPQLPRSGERVDLLGS